MKSTGTDHVRVQIGSVEVVIGIFMLFICIVVMNVLIGLTVSRTDYFVEIADLKRLRITAEAISSFEYFGIKDTISWNRIEVSMKPRKSFENRFFNQFCEAQSGNLVQSSVEYEAKLYYHTSLLNTELFAQTKDIGMTKFLIQKARKICEEHQINANPTTLRRKHSFLRTLEAL